MLICKECGSRLLITNTYNQEDSDYVERRLKCPKCGKVYRTVEKFKEEADSINEN